MAQITMFPISHIGKKTKEPLLSDRERAMVIVALSQDKNRLAVGEVHSKTLPEKVLANVCSVALPHIKISKPVAIQEEDTAQHIKNIRLLKELITRLYTSKLKFGWKIIEINDEGDYYAWKPQCYRFKISTVFFGVSFSTEILKYIPKEKEIHVRNKKIFDVIRNNCPIGFKLRLRHKI
jgi:hypothetical protein